MTTARPAPTPVLLFDGECGLCQRLVRLLIGLDRGGRLHFAPLQGAAAQAWLRAQGLPTEDFDTLVFVPDWAARGRGDFLVRTAGAMAALRATDRRRARALAAAIGIFPPRVRDAGYKMVARWRHRIFGPWRPEPRPRADWAARFLP